MDTQKSFAFRLWKAWVHVSLAIVGAGLAAIVAVLYGFLIPLPLNLNQESQAFLTAFVDPEPDQTMTFFSRSVWDAHWRNPSLSFHEVIVAVKEEDGSLRFKRYLQSQFSWDILQAIQKEKTEDSQEALRVTPRS